MKLADFFNIQKIKQAIADYIRVKVELLKLDVTEYLANILAQVIAYIVILIMLTLVIAFSSMGVSFLLNELLDSTYLGFLITAGFYLFILLIILILLKTGKLKSFFEKKLISREGVEIQTLDED